MTEPARKPPNVVRFFAAVAVAVVLGWIVFRVRAVLAPLIAGLILAYILNPLVNRLERRGWKRLWGTVAVMGSLLAAIVGVAVLIVPPAVRSSVDFTRSLVIGHPPVEVSYRNIRVERAGERLIVDWSGFTPEKPVTSYQCLVTVDGEAIDPLDTGLETRVETSAPAGAHVDVGVRALRESKLKRALPHMHDKLQSVVGRETLDDYVAQAEDLLAAHSEDIAASGGKAFKFAIEKVGTGVGALLTAVSWIVLVPIYTFFALIGMDPLWKKAREAIPAPIRPRALKTLERIHRANAAFFRGQTTICLIKAVLGVAGYGLTGLPFWFLVGLAHGALSFFPFVGVATAFMLVSVLGFVDVGFSWALAAPLGVLVAIELLEGFVLQPLILGKETDLHPVLVILSFMIVGELFGFFGLLLAVPLFTAGLIVFEDYVIPLYTDVGDHLSAEFQDGSV